MPNPPFAAKLASVLAFAALAAAALAGIAGAHEHPQIEADLRVAVQPHADGRIEFGLIQDGRRTLPELRYLTSEQAASRADRWLRSSAVRVAFRGGDPEVSQRADAFVIVRPHASGRIEFGIQVGDRDSERLLPKRRYLDPEQQTRFAGQWLESSIVTAAIDAPPAEQPEAADSAEPAAEPEPADEPEPAAADDDGDGHGEDESDADADAGADGPDDADDGLYRIPDGPRAGAVAVRNVLGDPDAPVLIRDISDFL